MQPKHCIVVCLLICEASFRQSAEGQAHLDHCFVAKDCGKVGAESSCGDGDAEARRDRADVAGQHHDRR